MNCITIFFFGITIVFLSSCAQKHLEITDQEQVVTVKADTLAEVNISMLLHYPGVLSSKKIIKLSFKTGGIIERILVNEGNQVRKGQIVASLDMTEIASLATQAGLAFEKAERDLGRITSLFRDTVATLEQLQDATSAFEAALQNKNIAEFNLQYSKITVPADGRIIARLSEEHEMVGAGLPVLLFSENGKDEWIVKIGISDKDIVEIKNGDMAEVSFEAYPGVLFQASVSQVSEMADPLSGTFEIEVTVSSGNRRLLNGLIAHVRLISGSNKQVTIVPPEALVEADGEKGFVYAVDTKDTTVNRLPVTIVFLQDDRIAVIESVNKFGPVVTRGASFLQDGVKVRLSE